ncbi:MAG: Arc family DNA-binding protein [Clostridia bacterium]|nr:Arc family DNA-binding protein [Clostridia bacterium]
MQRIADMEAQVLKKEKALKEKEKAKKQVLLRLAPSLWDEIASWAEDDFRSINSQIEYLLTEAVRSRRKGK